MQLAVWFFTSTNGVSSQIAVLNGLVFHRHAWFELTSERCRRLPGKVVAPATHLAMRRQGKQVKSFKSII